ncbi:hypothetical protein HYALB_00010976 [Hymenoscyphus albidus]|uniref:Ketopantoate reductase C-terminal domain-containing protein n=1 Tax=Hymenoscyphus albidus TaxID=595503 RepID=A0A9N9LRD3_9HELO|nr:hypothetical protein HYALB_00010976 [Hymenoscyphus albidus]
MLHRPTYLRCHQEKAPSEKGKVLGGENIEDIYEHHMYKITSGDYDMDFKKSGIQDVRYSEVSRILVGEPVGLGNSYDSGQYPPDAFSARYLREELYQTNLNIKLVTDREVTFRKLGKLAIASITQPLSVIFDCVGPEIVNSIDRMKVVRRLLQETVNVLSKYDERFTPSLLTRYRMTLLESHSGGPSKMQVKIKLNESHDIDGLNGMIVEFGRWTNLGCPLHEEVIRLVKEKAISQASARTADIMRRKQEQKLRWEQNLPHNRKRNLSGGREGQSVEEYEETWKSTKQRHNPPKSNSKSLRHIPNVKPFDKPFIMPLGSRQLASPAERRAALEVTE